MGGYPESVSTNVAYLEARTRELAEQEIDRARGLDSKATALLATIVALIAAAAAFGARMPDIAAGSDARWLWAAEVGVALVFLLAAGGFAVLAIAPRAVRTAVHIRDVRQWRSKHYLMQDPEVVQGILLNANVHSVGHSRDANARKAKRLKIASALFGAALAAIVLLAVSLATHDASAHHPTQHSVADRANRAGRAARASRLGRTDVSHATHGSQARRRLHGGH